MPLRIVVTSVLATVAFIATLFMIYVGIEYPFLEGAGLAQADFEATFVLLFLGIPVLLVSLILLVLPNEPPTVWRTKFVTVLCSINLIGLAVFFLLWLSVM